MPEYSSYQELIDRDEANDLDAIMAVANPYIGATTTTVADGAEVHAVDQHATLDAFEGGVVRSELTVEEVRAADLVIVLTDHDNVDYEMVVDHATAVLDTRHRLEGRNVAYL